MQSRDAWKTVHRELTRLARARGAYDADEATWLLRAKRERVHEHLGYGSTIEYLERLFGYAPRLASEKLRVAEALETLPAMRERLAAGELPWSAVRELARVATKVTEGEWIEAALGRTVRQVEHLVSGRRPGDRPGDRKSPELERHVLRLELSGEAFAAYREARAHLETEAGHALTDADALLRLAHLALSAEAGDGDDAGEGRAKYQVLVTVCDECGRGQRDGAGAIFDLEPAATEAALCDAQVIGTHVGDPLRATQDIPPKVRRFVLRRDHGRCQVPGCRAAKYLDLHHIEPRAEGGAHVPDNLLSLCDAHHAAAHRGTIRIEGTASAFVVLHADGRPYGVPIAGRPVAAAPLATEVAGRAGVAALTRDAQSALTHCGFSRAEAERAVRAAEPAPGEPLEALLRRTLRLLAPPTRASRSAEPAIAWFSPAPATCSSCPRRSSPRRSPWCREPTAAR